MSRPARTARPDSTDRLAAAHAHLIAAVEALTTGEAWRRMLALAAILPSYSANNVLLIGVQRPDATRVAGIRTWNSLGRRVRKGEKGIAILAPCLYRARNGGEPDRRDGAIAHAGAAARLAEDDPARQLRGFRVVHVFDQGQTIGEPLADLSPAPLRGAAPARLTARLVETISADGYSVERGPCADGAFGHTDFRRRAVRVRDDVSGGQAAKVFAHELAHIRADHETRFLATYRTSHGCRAQAEVEAESIAFLVTNAAGLPAEAYSVPYLAGWSGGDTELLRDAATRVIGTARAIVTDLGLDRGASALRDPARPTRNRGVESPGSYPEPPAPEGLR